MRSHADKTPLTHLLTKYRFTIRQKYIRIIRIIMSYAARPHPPLPSSHPFPAKAAHASTHTQRSPLKYWICRARRFFFNPLYASYNFCLVSSICRFCAFVAFVSVFLGCCCSPWRCSSKAVSSPSPPLPPLSPSPCTRPNNPLSTTDGLLATFETTIPPVAAPPSFDSMRSGGRVHNSGGQDFDGTSETTSDSAGGGGGDVGLRRTRSYTVPPVEGGQVL